MLLATVTPSLVIWPMWSERGQRLVSVGTGSTRGSSSPTHLGSTKGLLDNHVASLGSESNRDSLGEDVDSSEEGLPTLVREEDLLVSESLRDEGSAAGEGGAGGLERGAEHDGREVVGVGRRESDNCRWSTWFFSRSRTGEGVDSSSVSCFSSFPIFLPSAD